MKKSDLYGSGILFISALLVFTAMALSGCERPGDKEGAGVTGFTGSAGEPAALFEVATFYNGVFSLEAAARSPVVINFWASWCGPCRLEAEALQEAYQKFKDSGVRFVGIAVQDTEEGSKKFIDEFNLTFPSGPDTTGEIMRAYRVFGIPKTFIVGRDGRVSYVHSGAIFEKVLTREIMKVL